MFHFIVLSTVHNYNRYLQTSGTTYRATEGTEHQSHVKRNVKTSNDINLVRFPRQVQENDYDSTDTAKRSDPIRGSNVSAALPHGQIALPDGYNKFEIPKHPCKCLELYIFKEYF